MLSAPSSSPRQSPFWWVIGCFCVLSILGCGDDPWYVGPPALSLWHLFTLLPPILSLLMVLETSRLRAHRWVDEQDKLGNAQSGYLSLYALSMLLSASGIGFDILLHGGALTLSELGVYASAAMFLIALAHGIVLAASKFPASKFSMCAYLLVAIFVLVAHAEMATVPEEGELGGPYYPVRDIDDFDRMPWYLRSMRAYKDPEIVKAVENRFVPMSVRWVDGESNPEHKEDYEQHRR